MAQSKTTHAVKNVGMHRPSATQDKIAQAMKLAASQAKKQLAAQGLKLPTQNWAGSTVRNPVA